MQKRRMQKRTLPVVFCIMFILILAIPLLSMDLRDHRVSDSENRYLAPKPRLFTDTGGLNRGFTSDFEAWINDNLGFRSLMVKGNAQAQYHLFGVLSNNTDMYLGPHGELDYATDAMIADYQHNNLYDEGYLKEYADSMQYISDYVEAQGRVFFYFQCWDKHSIYPEYFPTSVIQHGDVSRTDQLMEALGRTTVKYVSPKKELMDAKGQYDTYSRWGDPSHWTTRGSVIGYNTLLEKMNAELGTGYHLLMDDDFNITIEDKGATLFGGVHEEDLEEAFSFKESGIENHNELLTLFSDDPRSACFVNPVAESGESVLLLADSYFAGYCIYDFAYTFRDVVFIHADHVEDLAEILAAYPSRYVVLERAERVDSSQAFINTARKLYGLDNR